MISKKGLVPLLLALAVSSVGLPAWGQSRVSDYDWRRSNRPPPSDLDRRPPNYALEFRFAPYSPEVDEEFGGTGPYSRVFDQDPQFYFGVEIDWLPLRIPYIGGIGPGFGWGYTRASTPAKITDCEVKPTDSCESGEDTSLTIMPMYMVAVLRADELMRRTRVPIVPYAKVGVGFGTWSAALGGDTAEYKEVDAEGNLKKTLGRDTTWGTHLALGAALSMNFVDPRAGANMYDSAGVQHFYLFGEWMWANLDGLGTRPQMHIGTSTWVAGMAFDM